jgi:predicted Kef-type K+ transport protein
MGKAIDSFAVAEMLGNMLYGVWHSMLDMRWTIGKVTAFYVNIVQLQVYLPGIARIQLYTTLLELHTLLL